MAEGGDNPQELWLAHVPEKFWRRSSGSARTLLLIWSGF